MQSKLLTTPSHANRRSIMTHNSPSQTHTYQTSLISTKPVNHIPRPTLNSWVLTSIVISCLLSGSVAECPLHNPCISRVSGFLDRQLCCQASLQPISENSYYQGLGMGWEWKHVLLYLANTLAVHGLTCPICFQCRGRPDFYFKVFCATLSQTPLSCGLRMWTDGSLWQNFPAFFTLRVSHLHGYSEIRFSSFPTFLKYTGIFHMYEFSYERQQYNTIFPQNSS